MFERFSDGARRVVVLAQEEARLLHHNYIGTEHLLLALLNADSGGTGAEALIAAGITYERARREVLEIIGDGGTVPSGHIPFTPRAKTVLELSLREALELGDDEIRSEHILLGLIREGTGVAAQVIVKSGMDFTKLRQQVASHRGMRGDEPRRAVARGAMSGYGMPGPAQRRAVARGARRPGGMLQTWGSAPVPRCSFCGRGFERLPRVLVASGVSLCDSCARAAVAQLDELPDDSPQRVRFRRRQVALLDEPDAIAGIERAFDAAMGPAHVLPAEALWAVEGGAEHEQLLVVMDAAAARAPVVVNDQTVERVRFVDEGEAEISLALWTAGSTTPMIFPAHAVLEDGTWKVSRSTVEFFAGLAQQFARPPD